MAPDLEENVRRLLIVGLVGLVFAGFILTNVDRNAGLIFGGLSIAGMFVIMFWEKFVIPGKEVTIEGIEPLEQSVPDIIFGLVATVGFMLLSTVSEGFSVMLPIIPKEAFSQVPFGTTFLASFGQGLVIILLAPVVEEIFFRGALRSVILEGAMGLSAGISNLIQAAIFAAYHILVYASALNISAIAGQSGAFLTAFVLGWSFGKMVDYRKNMVTAIIMHGAFNGFLFATLSVVLG